MGILDNVEGFLSPQAIAGLHRTIHRGYKTAQEFMDPEPQVEILRSPAGGGPPVSLGTFDVIMIRFGVREVSTQSNTGPITISGSSGQMHHEADAFDLQAGDIVIYQGRSSTVESVNPPEFGVVISDLKLMQ